MLINFILFPISAVRPQQQQRRRRRWRSMSHSRFHATPHARPSVICVRCRYVGYLPISRYLAQQLAGHISWAGGYTFGISRQCPPVAGRLAGWLPVCLPLSSLTRSTSLWCYCPAWKSFTFTVPACSRSHHEPYLRR